MVDFKVLGHSLPRVDALDKVTGQATYAADVYLPGMLMCKLLSSNRSHARIVSIDTSGAEQLPGVRCVITGKDFPDIYFGSGALMDRRVMARDEVFYIGEPVAAVGLLNQNPDPTLEDAKYAIGGNLCRCTGYTKVLDAIMAAARTMGS